MLTFDVVIQRRIIQETTLLIAAVDADQAAEKGREQITAEGFDVDWETVEDDIEIDRVDEIGSVIADSDDI